MTPSDPPKIATDLCGFIGESPTPFHVAANLATLFAGHGFVELDEGERWKLEPNGKYFVRRNDSSFIAFRNPHKADAGIKMTGAHTDSPCLRIKPNPDLHRQGYWQLGVEVYGGMLMHPWFDRDLSIAGRVSGVRESGQLFSELIDFKRPIAIIPSLAIHLNRGVNEKSVINAQKHLPIIVGQASSEQEFKQLLLAQCEANLEDKPATILDFELSCYDTQAPAIIGMDNEFVSSARLDNQLSTYIAARALLDADTPDHQCVMYITTDHEEIGSSSSCGAQGPFLKSVLERLTKDAEALTQSVTRSSLISCDNAHGIHPNYADVHDRNHGPRLNQGPVIKINNNQRYATNSITSAEFQRVCQAADVPFQQFVVRSDMSCGSTIGPIISAEIGIDTIDIGAPQWAMHSIRETTGTLDCEYLYKALLSYYG
ncbi:MAG: M18 family aminopeptidase [Pseudomonadota bacterium]